MNKILKFIIISLFVIGGCSKEPTINGIWRLLQINDTTIPPDADSFTIDLKESNGIITGTGKCLDINYEIIGTKTENEIGLIIIGNDTTVFQGEFLKDVMPGVLYDGEETMNIIFTKTK